MKLSRSVNPTDLIDRKYKEFRKWFRKLDPNQRKNYVCLTFLAVLAVTIGITAWFTHRPMPDKPYSKVLQPGTVAESHVLFMGDMYWGRAMHDWSQQNSLKEAYPFSGLHTLQPDKYDAWVANLECPTVPDVHQPIGFHPQLWEFNCDAAYLPHAAKWFDIVSLANNHTANQKRETGLAATRAELDRLSIQHFGGFNPHKAEDVCEVVSLPARVSLDGKQQTAALPIAMCGYHGVYYTVTDKAVSRMQRYAKYMPVIAYPHMGTEYQASADTKRRALYQKMIDNGADAVLANHPHWVQETEVYKQKLIVYSMGNLIFDQQFSQEVMRAAGMDVVMSLDQRTMSEDQLRAWVEIGKTCKGKGDDCLQQARHKQLPKLAMNFSYDVIGIDTSKQLTHRANNRVYKGILERMKWSEVQKQGTVDKHGRVTLQ